MALLDVKKLSKIFGEFNALLPTDLIVEQGEFVTLLGPSGCGKSTLLRMLMGITTPTAGEIKLKGRRIDNLPPEKRNISMVFQSYALFPHMSVEKNITFGMRMKGVSKDEQAKRVAHAVDICNLTSYLDRMPRQLSGGQQQRVALARAIVMQSDLLLFDEPLSNLDAKLRESLREDLLNLHRKVGATSLYVTHDQTEAMTMSDRVVVMNGGSVVEIGRPADLYRAPRTLFAARFLGQANILSASASEHEARLPWGQVITLAAAARGNVSVCARPEDITLTGNPTGAGTISNAQFHGASTIYTVSIADIEWKASIPGKEQMLSPGDRVDIEFRYPLHVLEENVALPNEVAA